MARQQIRLTGVASAKPAKTMALAEDGDELGAENTASLLSLGLARKGERDRIDLIPAASPAGRLEQAWIDVARQQRIVREKDLAVPLGDLWGKCFRLDLAPGGQIMVQRTGRLAGGANTGQTHSPYDVAMLVDWLRELAALALRGNRPVRDIVVLPEADSDMRYEGAVAPVCDARGQPCAVLGVVECLGLDETGPGPERA